MRNEFLEAMGVLFCIMIAMAVLALAIRGGIVTFNPKQCPTAEAVK